MKPMEKPNEKMQEALLRLRSQICPCEVKPEHTVGWCEALRKALKKGERAKDEPT